LVSPSLFAWPETGSPSKLKSPAKASHGDDGEPIFSPYGDLLPTRVLKDTATLVSQYSERPSASARDFTRVRLRGVVRCWSCPYGCLLAEWRPRVTETHGKSRIPQAQTQSVESDGSSVTSSVLLLHRVSLSGANGRCGKNHFRRDVVTTNSCKLCCQGCHCDDSVSGMVRSQ
jgi:hypothetical protein